MGIDLIFNVGIPVALIVLAMITGTLLEKAHYRSIRAREEQFKNLPAISCEYIDQGHVIADARMVTGSVVISIDHFKRFLAGLRNIVGGRVGAYESLVDRGRREATLRMKEQCPDADMITNFRIETSSVSQNAQLLGSVEVLAYGTAIKYQR